LTAPDPSPPVPFLSDDDASSEQAPTPPQATQRATREKAVAERAWRGGWRSMGLFLSEPWWIASCDLGFVTRHIVSKRIARILRTRMGRGSAGLVSRREWLSARATLNRTGLLSVHSKPLKKSQMFPSRTEMRSPAREEAAVLRELGVALLGRPCRPYASARASTCLFGKATSIRTRA
jgi:hypothetical protein